MSTAFSFTFPRRLALSTGLSLIRWARRPTITTEERRQLIEARRRKRVRALAREEWIREQRERDAVRYLSQVRTII